MKATSPFFPSRFTKISLASRPISSTDRHDFWFNDICKGREKGQDASRCNHGFISFSLSFSFCLSICLSLTTRFATKRQILFSVSSSANRCREASRAVICLGNNRRSVHFRTLRDSAEQHTHTYAHTHIHKVAGYDVYAIRCRLPREGERILALGAIHVAGYCIVADFLLRMRCNGDISRLLQ